MRRYICKSSGPIVMTLLAHGEECHMDFYSKSCTYPILETIDPLKVKIISILLYKNINCPIIFYTFTTDNSSFLTTVQKIYPYFFFFFLFYEFKLLILLKRLYSVSSTTYIHDPLPVTL